MGSRVVLRVKAGETEKVAALVEKVVKLGVEVPQSLDEWFCIVVEKTPTCRAEDLVFWVRFEPTQRFLDLLATLWARDRD